MGFYSIALVLRVWLVLLSVAVCAGYGGVVLCGYCMVVVVSWCFVLVGI